MSRQWYDRHEIAAMSAHAQKRENDLRDVVIELAAALVRMDKNGYQEQTLDRTLKVARVTREQVDTFNVDRLKRIAARQADRG